VHPCEKRCLGPRYGVSEQRRPMRSTAATQQHTAGCARFPHPTVERLHPLVRSRERWRGLAQYRLSHAGNALRPRESGTEVHDGVRPGHRRA